MDEYQLPPILSHSGGASSFEPATVDITDELWDRILRLYLLTYRGPTADAELKQELQNYQVLRRDAKLQPGCYVRYMARGIAGNELRRGGYVVKCTSKTVHLQNGRRQWQVSRYSNYIFVHKGGDALGKPSHRKSVLRMMAEEAIRKDDKRPDRDSFSRPPSRPHIKFVREPSTRRRSSNGNFIREQAKRLLNAGVLPPAPEQRTQIKGEREAEASAASEQRTKIKANFLSTSR